MTRMPLAPNFIAVCTARLSARRNAMRRSSCWQMFSATSCALTSALRTSWMFKNTSESVMRCTSFLSCSTPAPRLPMMIPGRAEKMLIFTLFAARSIVISDRLAWPILRLRKRRSLRSSCNQRR